MLDKSCLTWKIPFPIVPKPSSKSIKHWKDFIQWLKDSNIVTMCDFATMCKSKVQMTENNSLIKEIDNEQENYYQKSDVRHSVERHERIENPGEHN